MSENIDKFVSGWNGMVETFGDDYFKLKATMRYLSPKNLIEDLVKNTNISMIPIGSIGFSSELNEVNNNCFEFGFYCENHSLFIDSETGEILAANPSYESSKLIFASKGEQNFLSSLIFYGHVYFNRVLRKVYPNEGDIRYLGELTGGAKYGELYRFLFRELT